jgi:hypothetical protein
VTGATIESSAPALVQYTNTVIADAATTTAMAVRGDFNADRVEGREVTD